MPKGNKLNKLSKELKIKIQEFNAQNSFESQYRLKNSDTNIKL